MGYKYRVDLVTPPPTSNFPSYRAAFPRKFHRKAEAQECIASIEHRGGKATLVSLDKERLVRAVEREQAPSAADKRLVQEAQKIVETSERERIAAFNSGADHVDGFDRDDLGESPDY